MYQTAPHISYSQLLSHPGWSPQVESPDWDSLRQACLQTWDWATVLPNYWMKSKGDLARTLSNEWHHGHLSECAASGVFPHPPASWLHISTWNARSEHVCLNTLRNMWQPQSNHNITGEWGTSTQKYYEGEITFSSVTSAWVLPNSVPGSCKKPRSFV